MIILLLGLLIFTISVYGTAWILTQSSLLEPLRSLLVLAAQKTEDIPVIKYITANIAYLFSCIVCTATWVGILFALTANNSAILSQTFPPIYSILDVIIWAGWSAATSWMLASKFDPE